MISKSPMNAMRNRRALISRRRTRDPIFESKEKIKGRRIEIEKCYPVGCRVVHKQSNRSGSVVSRVNKFPRRWPRYRPIVLLTVQCDEGGDIVTNDYYNYILEPREKQVSRLIKALPRLLFLSAGPLFEILKYLVNDIEKTSRKYRRQ